LIPQGTLPRQPIKVDKWAFFADQSTLSHRHSETDCNITIPISKGDLRQITQYNSKTVQDFKRLERVNFSTLCTILVTFGPEIPQFTLLTIVPFAAIRQNWHITSNISEWTYLDLLYMFGRHIGGDDYPDIRLAVF